MTLADDKGMPIVLDRKLGAGGKAEIHSVVGWSDLVAKIYYKPSAERTKKLRTMLDNPPRNPISSEWHTAICWPTALLFDVANACRGFVMPRVGFSTNVPVLQLLNPQDRQQIAPGFNWSHLVRTAANIASIVEAVHAGGARVEPGCVFIAHDNSRHIYVKTWGQLIDDARRGSSFSKTGLLIRRAENHLWLTSGRSTEVASPYDDTSFQYTSGERTKTGTTCPSFGRS